MRSLRRQDWHAIAAVVAAAGALVLHFLHVIEGDILSAVLLVLVALLMLRDVQREAREERAAEATEHLGRTLARLEGDLRPPDAVLVGPRRLRESSERFAREARGDMVWFNVCLLMFRPQTLFDVLLRPAIENPHVSSIQFILDASEEERWRNDVLPKVEQCHGSEKVREPAWHPLEEAVSFILADDAEGDTQAHLSFWGEPFMARSTGGDVPRYVFHVQPGSELIPRLVELERSYRLGR